MCTVVQFHGFHGYFVTYSGYVRTLFARAMAVVQEHNASNRVKDVPLPCLLLEDNYRISEKPGMK